MQVRYCLKSLREQMAAKTKVTIFHCALPIVTLKSCALDGISFTSLISIT